MRLSLPSVSLPRVALPRPLRDALVVARFDLAESLRSRRVLVFLVLYVAASVASTVLFTEVLQEVEEVFAARLMVARTHQPGSLTQAVMQSTELHEVLSRLVGDDALVTELLRLPPVALVYHWISVAFAPVFVMLTASDTVSSEVATGSVRFSLFRTDRGSWAVGKLLGQSALLAVGLLCGAAGAWVTGWIQLASFQSFDTAVWLLRYAGTAFFFAFAHVGMALAVSQLTRSVPWSRALGLLCLVAAFVLPRWLEWGPVGESAPALSQTLAQLFPSAHRLDLWRPELASVARSALMLTALGVSYFSLGHLRFARRDA